MKKSLLQLLVMPFSIILLVAFTISGCKKSKTDTPQLDPRFNLDVVLKGTKGSGYIKFRQNSDTSKIVNLETGVRDLMPNHEYKLQRAVDTNIDGNCTGTAWLTLGKGSQPQSIFTDGNGIGTEQLFRSLAAVASGTQFDIHFQIIDALTQEVVLTSDCYQFTVR